MLTPLTSGTADGMFAFLDFVKNKKYGTPGAVEPLKSASRRVIGVVEPEAGGTLDVQNLDLQDFLERYENAARGDAVREETISAYKSRFTRSVESYRAYLANGEWRDYFRTGRRTAERGGARPRGGSSDGARRAGATTASFTGALLDPADDRTPQPPPEYLDYKFPLQGGRVAELRLPRELEKADADRLSRLIQSLVLESPLALPSPQE